MSNVIKAAQYRKEIVIDSNPKADLFFSGLDKTAETITLSAGGEKELPEETLAAMKEKASELLAEAEEEGKRIMAKAYAEAEAQKNAVMETARNDGYRDGYNSGLAALKEQEEQLREQMLRCQQDYEEKVKELEPLFSELTIRYVEKLTGILMEEKRPVIGYLMGEAIRHAEPSKSYVLYVSPEEYEEVNAAGEELRAMVSSRAVFEILPDEKLTAGECKLETDGCVIDGSLGTRLSILKENIRLLTAEDRENRNAG